MIIEKPGIYHISNQDYHATQAMSLLTGKLERIMSKSGLTRGSRSWAHFKASVDFPMAPSPIMEFGTDAHTAVLEHGRWEDEKRLWLKFNIIPPSFTGKGAKERRETWQADYIGYNFVTSIQYQAKKEHFRKIDRIREETYKHPESAPLLENGHAELSVFWFDEKYQVWLKARPDYLTADGVYVEFKTCPDARSNNFLRYIGHLNYHWHALYLDGLTKVTGYPHTEMKIIAVETKEPHAVNMFPIDTATMEIGRLQYRSMIKEFVECLKTDKWPAYSLNNSPLRFSRQALTVPDDVWENWEEY